MFTAGGAMENNKRDLLTIEEMANRLRVGRTWIYRQTMRRGPGSIPRVKIGKYIRFVEADVMKWIQSCQDS
jgi:excisionase family DNA binding protein